MARLLRADDVETATFTQTQFREGYDERQVDDLLADVVATLRRYESATAAGGFRMESGGLASVRFTPTRVRRGYDHVEVDAFLADVVHTLEHHEATSAAAVVEPVAAVDPGEAAAPAAPERESWRARVVRVLRGEEG